MEIFSVELAGVPVEIRCRYQENITFLREYLTEKEPLFTVAPGEEDLLRMQGDFDRMDRAEGIPPHRRGRFQEKKIAHKEERIQSAELRQKIEHCKILTGKRVQEVSDWGEKQLDQRHCTGL